MTTREQLIKRMRLLEQDHKPDGYPAVQMRDISALLDMLEADGVPVAWQPIETAPKDGTVFLGKLPDSDVPHAIRWTKSAWVISWDGFRLEGLDAPTDWMPMPPAPETQPAIQAERVPLTSKQAIAMREARHIGASDAWFKARYEGLDTRHSRNIFEAGFNRGWDAAHGIGADK